MTMRAPSLTLADIQGILERAAILQYDHKMTRAGADAQAVREFYDARMALPAEGMIAELALAERTKSDPRLASILAAMRPDHPRACSWGFLHIVIEGNSPLWRPAIAPEFGNAACVVAATQDGSRLVDLAAATLDNHRITLMRNGAADLIGADEVERARETGCPLLVFDSILNWLQGGTRGCVVTDWARAAAAFNGLSALVCGSLAMAERLDRATTRCLQPPVIGVLEGKSHAA